jgi:hypothetical protein
VIRQEIGAYNRSSTTTYDERLLARASTRMEQSEYVNRRRTDNTMVKIKGQKDKQRSTNHTHKTKDRVTRTPLKIGFITIYQLITFDSLFFSKYSTAKIKIWQNYLLTQGIRPDDKMTVIHLIHITCWPYHFTIGPFTRSNCCIKNFVKVFFRKVFWSCKPASKTLSKNADWHWQIWRNRNPILLFWKL